MDSLLFQVSSGLVALLVALVWIKPTLFRVLVDQPSGQPSLWRQGQFTSMMTCTWALVALVLGDKLTEWFLGLFLFTFAGAQLASIGMKIGGQLLKDKMANGKNGETPKEKT